MSRYDCVYAQEKTRLSELRQNHVTDWMKKNWSQGGASFYRKGIIGDHVNYFNQCMYEELEGFKSSDERWSKLANKLQYKDLIL